jgi:glycerol-3-phosphate dehydrogenase
VRRRERVLRKPVERGEVVWTYSGVRPLYDDGASKAQEATRDYVLALDGREGEAPLLSVFGGKITTYRRLAEAALDRLKGHLPAAARAGWTGGAPLPGGDFPHDGYDALLADILAAFPFLEPGFAARLVRTYGTRVRRLLDGASSRADLGELFGADLTEREVTYLMRTEWARTAADVLWRRSKLGLHLSEVQKAALDAFMRRESTLAAKPAA